MSERISESDVRHVARLSRLQMTEEKVAPVTVQLSHVLDYISKLNELDVSEVEPMAHPFDMTNVFREDEPKRLYTSEQMLQAAPDKWPPFFRVTKVMDDGGGA